MFYSIILLRKTQKNFTVSETTRNIYSQSLTIFEVDLLDRVNTIIEENINNGDFSASKLSEYIHLSNSTLCRKIKYITGVTPNKYIQTKRLNYSTKLLKQNMRPSEITYKCGFNDPSYFGACFKKKFGVAPKDYLKSL